MIRICLPRNDGTHATPAYSIELCDRGRASLSRQSPYFISLLIREFRFWTQLASWSFSAILENTIHLILGSSAEPEMRRIHAFSIVATVTHLHPLGFYRPLKKKIRSSMRMDLLPSNRERPVPLFFYKSFPFPTPVRDRKSAIKSLGHGPISPFEKTGLTRFCTSLFFISTVRTN